MQKSLVKSWIMGLINILHNNIVTNLFFNITIKKVLKEKNHAIKNERLATLFERRGFLLQ